MTASTAPPTTRPLARQPLTMRRAVRLMWLGGVLSGLSGLLTLAAAASELDLGGPLASGFATLLLVDLASVACWVWMAWVNGRGYPWARVVARMLFGLGTVYLLVLVVAAGSSWPGLLPVAIWLVGLAVIGLTNRVECSYFYRQARWTDGPPHPRNV